MQNPTDKSFGRNPVMAEASLLRAEYRRLFVWSFMLQARMHLLSALLTVSSPFATPGWLRLLRRWFDQLKLDAATFGRAARAWRQQQMALRQAAPVSREFQNPWV